MNKKIQVAVLYGGVSRERPVSLISGKAVADALRKIDKFEVYEFDPKTDLEKFVHDAKKIDVVFPVLHGCGGEDGTIQGLCELLNLPYVGSGVRASANAIHKPTAKDLYRAAKIPVADDIVMTKISNEHFLIQKNFLPSKDDLSHRHKALSAEKNEFIDYIDIPEKKLITDIANMIEENLGFPVVLKPAKEGSSFGISIPKNKEQFLKDAEKSIDCDKDIIIEEFLKGRELTVGVLGNADKIIALEPIEIIANAGDFYDYKSKYSDGGSTHILPANISPELANRAKFYAIRAHEVLGCSGMSRTDMFLVGEKIYVTETNTIPGCTPTSLLPEAAKHSGISFEKMCEMLVNWALEN